MITAIAAFLALQSSAPCVAAAALTDMFCSTWRADSPPRAVMLFSRADSLCPAFAGAQIGLGFAALRTARTADAFVRFQRAAALDSSAADAWYGLGLAHQRLGRDRDAITAWQRAVTLAPTYLEVVDALLAAGVEPHASMPAALRPDAPRVVARTREEHFEVLRGHDWLPFYVRGINLGTARPGRFPAEFPTDDSTFAHWIGLMADAHANVVRVYTILPPAFYRALARWNREHPDDALWLIQGVWAEPPPRDDYDDRSWKAAFRAEMGRAVDVVHGRARIARVPGHAFGRYDADVSAHVLAFIIGREWEPHTIESYNRRARSRRSFAGRFLVTPHGTPAEVWMAEQCDYLLSYEWDGYHAARPIAYTNWPTLDPLRHPTESTREEERELRRRFGFPPNPRLKEYNNDSESLDARVTRGTAANLAGWFAAFHAYPYYPDFIGLDSAYSEARSSFGPSHYFGYLRDLARHHAGMPVLIAEYGVPSSRGIAHLDPEGFHHGGHDEAQQAAVNRRLTAEIREAGLAGGIVFAWLDEWFKHSWVVIDLERPADHNPRWHNVEGPEQHYGLLGEYAGTAERPVPGGDPAAWRALPHVERIDGITLRAGADEAYLYLALEGAARDYVVGFDTFRPDQGQFALPGAPARAGVGVEFALFISNGLARLRVTPDYNPFLGPRPGDGPTALDRFYAFGATVMARRSDGLLDSLWVTTNRFRIARDGRTFPAQGHDRGRLRHGRADSTTLADWWADSVAGRVEVRIPWTLLNVTDPSTRTVLTGIRAPDRFTVDRTDGVRFVLFARAADGTPLAWSPGGPTFAWPTWVSPRWHERLKPAYHSLRDLWSAW